MRYLTPPERIADRTVAEEYDFAVREKGDALYDEPRQLPAAAEGSEMAKLRRQAHRRMLGNGYCARPVELHCDFESICEACTFFVTTIEFRPTLERQRNDAEAKGQKKRQQIFDGLLTRLEASLLTITRITIRSFAFFNGSPCVVLRDWLAQTPSPRRAFTVGYHTTRRVETSVWPPAGTST